jgi:hypothetical protein
MEKLKIKNSEIFFASLEEKDGFKPSFTIKVTPEIDKQISEFWAVNKIGKTHPGVPNFKEYTNGEGVTTRQFNIALGNQVKFAGLNGLTENDLGFGAKVNIFINAFTYNNKFSGGKEKVSANISVCVVLSGRKTGADADLAELLGDANLSTSESEATPKGDNDLPF